MTDTNATPNAADTAITSAAPSDAAKPTDANPNPDTNDAAKETPPADKTAVQPADKAPGAKPADKDPAAADAGKKDDAKPDDKKPADAKPDDKKETLADYTDFTMPETITVNPEIMTEFSVLAKKHGLSQEAAQEFASLGAKTVQKADGVVEATFAELGQKVTTKWEGESKADKEFGGAELDANLGIAKRAVDTYATPELKAILAKFDKKDNPNGTGLGNNPEVIRLFYRLGKTISPDTELHEGTKPNGGELSPGDRLWGKKS